MKIIIKVLFSLLIFYGFNACKVGPKYERPETVSPEKFRFDEVEQDSISNIEWWDIYQDTILQRLIKKGLENNRDIRIATQRLYGAMASRDIAKSDLFPQFGVNAGIERESSFSEDSNGNLQNSYDDELVATVGLSWELDIWGKIRHGKDAATFSLLAKEENRKSIILLTVSTIANDYFSLRDLDNKLRITINTVEAREEARRIAELRFKGGISTEMTLRQAEVELTQTQSIIPTIEESIAHLENEISVLIGENPNVITRGDSLFQQKIPSIIPVGLPSELLLRRPDIIAAENALKQATSEVGIAQANFFPSIALTTSTGYNSSSLASSSFIESPYWILAGGLITPIFTWGKLKGQKKLAMANMMEEMEDYKYTILNSFREVDDALISFKKSKEIRIANELVLTKSKQYLRLAELQYFNGIVSYLGVLDAQRTVFEAEITTSEAFKRELISGVNLYKALGGGWYSRSGELNTEFMPQ